MTRPFRRAAVASALLLVLVGASSCKKKEKKPLEIEAGPPPVESTADVDAKETVKVIVATYPVTCDAGAATRAWTACREVGGGYGKVYSCAEKCLRDARTALAGLRPSPQLQSECANEIEKAAVTMLNATPKFFTDITKWLAAHHDALVEALLTMPLGEACRSTKGLCDGEPHDYDDAYKSMRMHGIDSIECTTKLFKCGQNDAMDCFLSSVVPRLGVACAGTANRSGATPDDLLYVRETGTPLAR
jgi:hypothetical protein